MSEPTPTLEEQIEHQRAVIAEWADTGLPMVRLDRAVLASLERLRDEQRAGQEAAIPGELEAWQDIAEVHSQDVLALRAENGRLREALKFYAERGHLYGTMVTTGRSAVTPSLPAGSGRRTPSTVNRGV